MANANPTLDTKERERLRRKAYRQTPEYKARQKEHQRKWMQKPSSKELVRSLVTRWRKSNREKKAAHEAVERAIKSGELIRLPCWTCGADAEAHHADYSAPLAVVWLCRAHHKEVHNTSILQQHYAESVGNT